MSIDDSKKYDVFLSYAHADAVTEEGRAAIEAIKISIEDALKDISPKSSVFLDSMALEWGDVWNEKLRQCIAQCKVFVYLLSPNYIHSAYCRREKLLWMRREVERGRLHKTTIPIYYIKLYNDQFIDNIQENFIIQMSNRPFFESLYDVNCNIIREKIQKYSPVIKERVIFEYNILESYCSVFPKISKYFVGRVKELADLNDRCCNGHAILVISGYAGIGKTELAVAYAYAYAENFPQGRFLVPMEGVSNWNDAMVKLVEQCRANSSTKQKHFPLPENSLPEDWDRMPPDVKREAVYQMLLSRSNKGRLLFLLDNLEDMKLLTDKGLRELTGGAEWPDNICIIATTRLHECYSSSNSYELFELGPLSEIDAIELFCSIGDNIYPFSKYPMSNGRLLLDEIPLDKRPSNKEISNIEREYSALKEIIRILDRHTWSIELLAQFMAENYSHCNLQQELEDLRNKMLENLQGENHSWRHTVLDIKELLNPTLDKLQGFNDIDNHLGDDILTLATIAAFFPPDDIPVYALEKIWEKEFGNEKIVYDKSQKNAMKCDFAMLQLKKFHIVTGDGPFIKMHRITRETLLNNLPNENKRTIVKMMQHYWDKYQIEHSNLCLQQIQPWIGWATEWINCLPGLKKDEDFLWSMISISNECKTNKLYGDAEKLYSIVLDKARKINNELIISTVLDNLANLHSELNQYKKAEYEYIEALSIRRCLAENNPENYALNVADTLTNLAILHSDLNRHDEAEAEYNEALSIRRHLAATSPERYDSDVADTLTNLANLHSDLNRHDEAETEYKEALNIYRKLMIYSVDRYSSDVAWTLTNLANLHSNLNRHDDAEAEYKEALSIRRRLAATSPERYDSDVALTLTNLANLHSNLNRHDDAEAEYKEALSIRRRLATTSTERYDSDVALTLTNLATLHSNLNRHDDAEAEYKEALETYRRLAATSPGRYDSYVAMTLTNLANLHSDLNRHDEAEAEYKEALNIYRKLMIYSVDRYSSDVAWALTNLANLHSDLNRHDDAEAEYKEALETYRRLAEANHERFTPYIAMTLNNLANLHISIYHFKDAECEYREAITIYRHFSMLKLDYYDSNIAATLNNIAILHIRLYQYVDAKLELSEALSIYKRLQKKFPMNFDAEVSRIKEILALLSKHILCPEKKEIIT